MSEKVKVSMFLEPEVAKAIKVQAARQGSGMSEIVRNVFLCAHCREPITDEFVLGAPKLVDKNKYGVFFHKNRKECLNASGTKIVFFSECPTCKQPAFQEFDREVLFERLQNKQVKCYCIRCDAQWQPTADDAISLSRLLVAS
jgi:hypothetical protein